MGKFSLLMGGSNTGIGSQTLKRVRICREGSLQKVLCKFSQVSKPGIMFTFNVLSDRAVTCASRR